MHPRELGKRLDGSTAFAYDIKLEGVMSRDLAYDTQLYADVASSNARWRTSNSAPDADRVISDVFHGTEWRAHANLGSPTVGRDHPTFAWQMWLAESDR